MPVYIKQIAEAVAESVVLFFSAYILCFFGIYATSNWLKKVFMQSNMSSKAVIAASMIVSVWVIPVLYSIIQRWRKR